MSENILEKRIAEILGQPCDDCELEDNCDCRVRGIICPYQEKKAGQIHRIYKEWLKEELEGLTVMEGGEVNAIEQLSYTKQELKNKLDFNGGVKCVSMRKTR